MNVRNKWSEHTKAQKIKIMCRIGFILFLNIVVSPLMACVPFITNARPTTFAEVSVTTPETSTPATALVPVTSLTETPTPSATPVDTQVVAAPLTFTAEADARVEQSDPDKNFGDGTTLRADGAQDPGVESFIRFTVAGVADTIQSARLRLYVTDNGSRNGPAVYSTDTTWMEEELTWNTRPARKSEAVDNKEEIPTETWVEYDVTSLVTGNGTFSFLLAADSNDSAIFSSRQGNQPPQLVIMFGDKSPATVVPGQPAGDVIFVGAGDISDCDNDNDELTAQLLDTIPGTVFTTGDNVYSSGTSAQFANCYDPTWGRHKERTKPIPGNHDYRTADGADYFAYFNNIPSYYAYDLGAWRIYALNSEIDASADSPQIVWLLADIIANPRQCVLAYWHKPRWSSGENHGSDPEYQALWQIFYEAGAEIVLNGHEHQYERFAPMNAAGEPDPLGLREFVIGTGGKDLYEFGAPLPASEARNNTSYGVLKLTLHPSGYDWEFVSATGSTFTDSGSADCH